MKKVLLTALALWLLLPGCAKQEPVLNAPAPVASYAEGRELMAAAETREDAEALAALYGVELVDYREGLALFHTDEDPAVVKQRGIQNGWQELEINALNPLD